LTSLCFTLFRYSMHTFALISRSRWRAHNSRDDFCKREHGFSTAVLYLLPTNHAQQRFAILWPTYTDLDSPSAAAAFQTCPNPTAFARVFSVLAPRVHEGLEKCWVYCRNNNIMVLLFLFSFFLLFVQSGGLVQSHLILHI